MKTFRKFKKYIVGLMGFASLFMMAQANLAQASSAARMHRELDMINNVTVVSVTERDNAGGGKILDIVVENKYGEQMTLHLCSADCPQIQPKGPACPDCAENYELCKELLESIAGTEQRVSFKTLHGYVMGHYTGNGFHCFFTLG